MSKKNRLKLLRDQRDDRKTRGGCSICKEEHIWKEIDALIEALTSEDEHIGYFAVDLLRALNKMLPEAEVKQTRFRRHLSECRPGWNEPKQRA
jgi:hypothetical protein